MDGVAIIGMAGRFPGAASVDDFWRNLVAGNESIARFAPSELSPWVPAEAKAHPRYVPARGVIADADRFDAEFFRITPREALLTDPQQRVFLELCWNALEHAGIDTERYPGRIGVYAGVSNNGYRKLVEARSDLVDASGEFATMLANEKDYVATRVAHRIGLTGPAVSVYTACSTSLVAVAQAWYALMSWQCDAVLAGGINIVVPQESGYVPVEGGMESNDGHCRPFDAEASGTVFSSGGGVVVLKRLADAIADRDTIFAVIRGVAVNNDGAEKASFTAPSASGQAAAIKLALETADVPADTIGYVEAHGTGTVLGDPIEVEALARAYREHTSARQFCWLGSVKGNIGHLVSGAGVAGLIKAALALRHETIPPTLHFRRANPEIDFTSTPFRVAERPVAWPRGAAPRRAGVSSFGVGGTNAHIVLEEAPPPPERAASPRPAVVLPLSAKTDAALAQRAADLASALAAFEDADLADIGWTLATGRRLLPVRGAVVARSIAEARERLRALAAQSAIDRPRIVFLFPGQGSQHVDMARELVDTEPVFAEAFARCCAIASPLIGRDLHALILPAPQARDSSELLLAETRYAQPALFAIEYALAELWRSFGIVPDAMIGHSIGEYVAACIAGVFALEDALRLVVARGAAMDAQPRGAMLALRATEAALAKCLPEGVEVAAVNAADSVVVAGTETAIDRFAEDLSTAQIAGTRLRVSHAFHSALMEAALPVFRRAFDGMHVAAPTIPFYSCVSGRPIGAAEAQSPDYWCRQIRAPVRFADAATHALADASSIGLEVGPGQALAGSLKRSADLRARVVASLGPAREPGSAAEHVGRALAELWCRGVAIDWNRYWHSTSRRRVPLPGYPFRGPRYWIERENAPVHAAPSERVAASDGASRTTSSLVAGLRELAASLSGGAAGEIRDDARFFELGLDSLALTQFALELERRHGLKLKFRRLTEDLDTIAKLAAEIERIAPEKAGSAAAPSNAQPDTKTPVANRTGPLVPFGAAARITTRSDAQANPQQAAWLAAFIGRYTRRTAQSKAFADAHRAAMADPRVVTGFHPLWKELVYPIVVGRSRGARLWDLDGNEYIDLLNAFGANFFGYQPDFIKQALAEQIDAGFEIGPQHPLTAEVAALIRELTGVERVAFCNTGSEAVMGAMRIARTVTGRKTIVVFKDSYHGIFDEVIVRGTPELRSIAAAPGILASAVENVLVLDYGSEAALATIRARAHELAAVMIEPVQSRNPELTPREFVRALRAICDEAGCALIFDEVITGFRIAPGGAQEFFGVRADVATFGKIIGGGLPLAAIGGAAAWMDALDGGAWRFGDDSRPEAGVTYFAGTFVRHPLALAAAKASLLHLREHGAALQRELNARTAALVVRLNAFFDAEFAPMRALAFSSLWRIRIDADQPFAELFYYALRERGLHVYAQFNCFLSLAHGQAEAEAIAERIEAATRELLDAGVLKRKAVPVPQRRAAPNAPNLPARRSAVVTLPRATHDAAEAPMTDAQTEKWIAGRFGGNADLAFNESQLLKLDGPLDRDALERAIAAVGARHEAFAMTFAEDGGAFRIGTKRPLATAFLDFSGPEAEARLNAHCRDALRQPFDLNTAPLARVELVRLDAERHALFVVAHHLVFDGWSAAVFFGEIAEVYRAFVEGRAPALEPAQSFREFALEERERRRSEAAQAALEYWKTLYADPPEALAVPIDRRHPLGPDFSADTVFHDLPAELATALRGYARRHGITLYSVLLAAFGVLLMRLSGQREFAIGIPFAAQALADRRVMVGDGVNTLPLRLDIDADAGFVALAQRCHRLLLDAADNQDLTLHTLLSALGHRQRAERGVLTDVIFNLNPRVPALDFPGLRHSLRDFAKPALIKYLFFNLNERGDTLTLDVHYRTALFDAATIVRWIGHYQTLLQAIVAGHAGPVALLPVLDAAQWHALVHERNATAREFEPGATVVSLIREQARRTPQRIALECEGQTLRYGELLARAETMARALAASGIGEGDLVGLCTTRTADMVAGLLGVLGCGAAYLVLDASHPEERLRFVLDHAGVLHLVVGDRADLAPILAEGRSVQTLGELAASAADADLPPVRPGALAYVLYTSGSAGAPKGVRVLHRNLANFLLSMRERPGLHADDVLCAATALSFDIAGLELYLPLTVGARVVVATDRERVDPDALKALLRRHGVSVLQTTPSWLRVLVGNGRPRELAPLKLLVGGEELPRDLAEAVLPNCRELWNLYGPTETTVWSTLCRVTSGHGGVPIGMPIANTRIYLLDAHRQLVPPGVRGEIWIGGAGVAAGYLKQPELTAERFMPDPFVGGAERVYRTGDLGSWRGDELCFHGRIDHEFKLRGFRVDPSEIEAAALGERGVRAAVATLLTAGDGNKRLVLYVVAAGSGALRAQDLRNALRRRLPPHMVPQHIEFLDALPQTSHGKIDRKALPAPAQLDRPTETGGNGAEVPGNALERCLLEIWRDLLGIGDIGLDGNFFDLGGDSLLGVELFQRAHAKTGVNLPLSTLLAAQTVREQARLFREAGAHDATETSAPVATATPAVDTWSPLVRIQPGGSERPPLFCVHALGGNVLNYVPLARAIGTDQPVYGLQAVGLDGITPPLTSVEAMAERYLGEIRSVVPHGPYYLCGGSMGGLIAYEIAQRLAAENEPVAFLGLFDTYGPGTDPLEGAEGRLLKRVYGRWRDRWTRVSALDPSGRRHLVGDAVQRRISRGCDAVRSAWYRCLGTALPHNIRYRELERVHMRADLAYRPKPYFGPLTLFRASVPCERGSRSRTLGWDSVALGGLDVVDLPGTHDTLVEQPELASALRATLDRALTIASGAAPAPRMAVSP
ncbi:MAG TPA: amino acid adenylation domain-containing protein [Rudaea sp.]|nr:amino acid adenylation domain-containing protein [Rudaea sp.]